MRNKGKNKMLNNNLCASCDKAAVCRNVNILYKFDDSAKKPLGIDITIDDCKNYEKTQLNND